MAFLILRGNLLRCSSFRLSLIFGVFCFLTSLAYGWGLSGGFVFDDYPNLVQNEHLQKVTSWDWQALREASFSSDSGPLRRPLSMFSFALNHLVSGMDPLVFKATNLLIHALVAVTLSYLGRLLYSSLLLNVNNPSKPDFFWLSAVAAAIWMLHPLQLTSVLYVVQRMNSLAVLFIVLGMLSYSLGRTRQQEGKSGWTAVMLSYVVFLPLAIFSKENGALLPTFLLLIEIFVFRMRGAIGISRRIVLSLHLIFAILPVLLGALYLLANPEWILQSYSNRDFTLSQRLLTQARVLWIYVSMLFFPDISRMGLYHDDLLVSRHLFDPWTNLPAILGWISVLALSYFSRKKWPILVFSVCFFFIAHALESSFFGLEMMHEHRNYLASYGLIFGICFAGWNVLNTLPTRALKIFIPVALLGVLILLTAFRAQTWGSDLDRVLFEVKYHPESPRANVEAASSLLQMAENSESNRTILLEQAHSYFSEAAKIDSYGVNGLIGQLVAENKLGRSLEGSVYNQTLARLAKVPMASSTPDALVSLIKCQIEGGCVFEPSILLEMVRTAVDNIAMRQLDRARLFTEVVQMFLGSNDLENALVFAVSAVRSQPMQPQLRLNLALVLISLGRFQDAEAELDFVSGMVNGGMYANRLTALRESLERRKTNH